MKIACNEDYGRITDIFSGCLLGGAVGDALGWPVEFMSMAEIRQRFGPEGIRDFAATEGGIGAITDDTQMPCSPPRGCCVSTGGPAGPLKSRTILQPSTGHTSVGCIHRGRCPWIPAFTVAWTATC